LIVNFQDLSTGNPGSWAWDLGNGNSSTLQNPSATYFTPGTYTITLTVTNASGSNTLTRTQYITVYDRPTVNFSADVQTGCFPLRVQFTDLSSAPAGSSIVNWQWDFGNGVTSTAQNPQAVYTTAGNFAVTLKLTDDKGCTRILGRNAYINATPGVTAGFTATPPVACASPVNIQFNNTSTGPGTLSYQWDFGDGNTSSLPSPNHTYTADGAYTVTLTATSSNGCEDTVTLMIPVARFASSFQYAGTACPGSPVSFTNTSVPVPDSSSWTFGDGNTSSGMAPTHAYASAGTYTVWLYNFYGNCIDSASQLITIIPPPVANFTTPVSASCQSSLTANFQDLSTGASSWLWSFGDGSSSTDQHPVHQYNAYGAYTVTLIVTNSSGCSDTLSIPDYIRLQQPQVSIPQLSARGCIPFTISLVPVINSADAITSFNWDFGDGTTSTLQNPAHTYTVQGTYIVKLFFTTATGCTDSVIVNPGVRVGTKPVADFSATPLENCAFQPIQFTSLSAPADEWNWDFGDGGSSAIANPSYAYSDTGYFTVQLIAFNNGCPDTMTKIDYIHILPPISRFTAIADCNNRLLFSFTDQSIAPLTWSWDFGDGNTSALQNPTHTYATLGNYNVTLTVTNGSCTHSSTQVISSLRLVPDFTANVTAACKGTPVYFTPTSFDPLLTSSLIWNFGDGTQVTSQGAAQVSNFYAASGNYTVMLIAVDINGCRDTTIKPAYIRINGPTANFIAQPPTGCAGSTLVFTDLSTTDGINAITEWIWDFGDGVVQSFNAPPFSHVYSTADTFSVSLRITDAAGCQALLPRPGYIITSDPQPGFLSPDTVTCPGAPVRFTNTSIPSTVTSLWDFGDGTTSTDFSPIHTYADTGSYSIKLFITDDAQCTDSLVLFNYIHVVRPLAGFTVSDSFSACTPLEVQFTNTSENYIAAVWDFGPGEGNSSLSNPVHYFSTPGIYRVRLIITSPGGCTDSSFVNITVLDTAGLQFSYTPLLGCNPLTVNFSAIGPVSTQSYFWDYGDGNAVTNLPTVTHTYQSFGDYLPKVILLDPPGCVIPITGIDTIHIRGSNILFGLSDSLLCDAGSVSFTDSTTSSDPITGYTWTFGDGNGSSLQNPTHYYSAPGLYDVTLSVETQSGCVNRFTKTAAVKVVARPDIAIAGDTSVCIYDSLLHAGIFLQPDSSVVTWAWSFPNGNTASIQNPPFQTYSAAGDFTVFAFATNSSGCIDTASQHIVVHPLPTVDLPGQMTIQSGFSDTIPAAYSNGVNHWSWTPQYALSCFNCPRPVASPRATTTYQVAFSDINGCRNTGSIEVVVICRDANFYIPNTFSPNGDGSNDRFYPRGKGLYLIRALRVFNRWGEVVFENRNFAANDAMKGWDGIFKGRKAQPDVYVYQIEILCDNGELIKLSGNIALIL
jgi:gliding motility-associated-like protein